MMEPEWCGAALLNAETGEVDHACVRLPDHESPHVCGECDKEW